MVVVGARVVVAVVVVVVAVVVVGLLYVSFRVKEFVLYFCTVPPHLSQLSSPMRTHPSFELGLASQALTSANIPLLLHCRVQKRNLRPRQAASPGPSTPTTEKDAGDAIPSPEVPQFCEATDHSAVMRWMATWTLDRLLTLLSCASRVTPVRTAQEGMADRSNLTYTRRLPSVGIPLLCPITQPLPGRLPVLYIWPDDCTMVRASSVMAARRAA